MAIRTREVLVVFAAASLACASAPPALPVDALHVWTPALEAAGDLSSAQHTCAERAEVVEGTLDHTERIYVDESIYAACMRGLGFERVAAVVPSERVESHVNVRQDASATSPVLASLTKGERAALLSEESGWYRVRLADGSEGFVSADWTQRLASN